MPPELLTNLLTAPGPSGYEEPAVRVWREAASFADIDVDRIGSTIATIGDADASPLLAVMGHIDEIGVTITHVDENGFLFFAPIGGWDPQVLVGQRMRIETRDGPVTGVIGRKAIHLLKEEQRKQAVELDALHIDVGAGNRDRALEMIRIGDSGVIAGEPAELEGDRLVSRSMDNRLGAYVALESLRRCHERGNVNGRMAAIASVQEEIGLKGAATSAFALEPDLAIAIDVTHANDTPGADQKQGGHHPLGSGPVIGRGSTLSPKVFELLVGAAEELGIDYTVEASGRYTGTDADAIQISKTGVPAGLVSIPLRYMHSPVEMVDLGDLEGAVELVSAFAAALGPDVDLAR
jgi:endoglucanase